MQQAIYETITHVTDQLKKIGGVTGIVLFGSYARGDYEEGSDVDLLVIFKSKEALTTGQEQIYKITAQTDMFVQAIGLTLEKLKASTLVDSILREGKIYHATEEVRKFLTPIHRPYALLTYSTSNLTAKRRVVFTQELDGRSRGKYKYEGLLQRIGGYKVGRGVVMVPLENLARITNHLEEREVEYVVRYVWM